MLKWILAAIGVVVLSIAISATRFYLSEASYRHHPYDPAAYERDRQINLEYEPVSLVALLATPDRFEGRKVLVQGFVTLDFEGSGIDLDEATYKGGLRRSALWLDRPTWLTPNAARRLGHRYADVAGTFLAERHGHLGAYAGSLTAIQRIQPMYTDADYYRMRLRVSSEVLTDRLLSGWFLTLWGWMGLWALWLFRRAAR